MYEMSSSASDEWLIALLDEKSPDEFTPTELTLLRERAASSLMVRRALAERIRLEESLHAVLGKPPVTSDAILRRISVARRKRVGAWCAAALLLVSAAGFWWLASRPADVPRQAVARRVQPAVVAQQKPERQEPSSPSVPAPVEAARPVVANRGSDAAVARAVTNEPQAAAPQPWDAVLGDEAPVIPFADSAYTTFGETVPGFEVADEYLPSELTKWIALVPGRPFNVNEGQWRGKHFAGFEGIAKLLPAWRSDAVLRVAPFDTAEFALHFWNGNSGRTVRFYAQQRPQLLAAYATTREGEPTPKTQRLLSTDGGTYARANAGAMEIRFQSGQLVVTHGAVPLLVVPMEAPPTEVLLEARTRLRTFAMYRGEAAPLPPTIEHKELLANALPDEREWLVSAEPPAKIAKADGRIALTASPAPPGPRRLSWAAVRMPKSAGAGLVEAVFRIESLTPGTGVYVGNAEGVPVHTLFASENIPAAAPQLSYGWTSRDGNVREPRWRWDIDPKHELAPTIGPGTWVKLLVGPGGLKVYFSGDGEHWGPAARNPERAVRGAFASVGVFAMADGKDRAISVSGVGVRELNGITALADAKVRERVPLFGEIPPERFADWLTWATAARPSDVEFDAWMAACGVETLSRGASDAVSSSILDRLVQTAVESDESIEQTLALLHDAALLSDLWGERARGFADGYDRLSRNLASGDREPAAIASSLVAVEEGYLTSPIWTESRMWSVPPATARLLAAEAAWSRDTAAASSAARLAAYIAPAHPDGGWSGDEDAGLARLTSWGAAIAASEGSRIDGEARFGWQHPLTTEPGREGATIAEELRSALDAGAYEDAARLLATLAELADLVPAMGDPARYVPPAGLIAEAAAQHPDLVKTISEQFGQAALLRVRQSIAVGDEAAVHLAAIRYYGTTAAAEARRWLGETALAAGRFNEAERQFAAAAVIAPAAERATLEARRRLAAALEGEDAASPVGEAVTFGTQTFAPAEFEQLVGELKKARATANNVQHAAIAIPDAVPVLPQQHGRIEGDVGRNPDRGEFRRFDWAGRQIAVTVDRGVVYLTNRFQVIAFDPKRDARWWTVGLGGEQGDAHGLPNVAFTPTVQGERLFVRRLTSHGTELACLSVTEGGKLLWKTDAKSIAVSDPVLETGMVTLLTCAAGARAGGPTTLTLTRFRLDSGALVSSVPVLVLNESDDVRPSAQLLRVAGGYLLTTQGTAALCNASGGLAWLRRLPYLPSAADLDFDRLAVAAPLAIGDQVFIAEPGTRAVICLEIATGRLLWTRPFGELEELAGAAGDMLVAKAAGELRGLDRMSGRVIWTFRRENLLDGTLCDEHTIVATARTTLADRLDGLSLLRIDPKTGALQSEQLVRVQRNEDIQCGPLFVYEGTLWGLVGEGWRDPKRTLVSFTPDAGGLAVAHPADAGVPDEWITGVEPQTRLAVEIVLPGWEAIASQSGNGAKYGATLLDEHRGEKTVLATQAGRDRAARFVRRLAESQPHAKLVARVGREDDAGWTLRVFAEGTLFASEPINKDTAPDGWRTVTIDLTPLAKKAVTLAVDQAGPSENANKETKAFWKQLTVE
jgi:outer membrane protein assembly factor BamB